MMFEKMFNNVSLLKKGLDASWLKNEVISNNVANVDTPGFKSSSVEFELVEDMRNTWEQAIKIFRTNTYSSSVKE